MKQSIKLSRYAVVTIAVWAIGLILLAAGYVLLYVPQQTDRVRLERECIQSRIQLEEAQLAARTETREKIQLQSEEKNQMIAGFSTDYNGETELVFEIGQIASELHLAEFSSKHEEQRSRPTVGKGLNEGWLKVEFMASFEQFAQFINRLERNCPVVFVEEVFFRRTSESSKGHDVSLLLSFLTENEPAAKTVALATK